MTQPIPCPDCFGPNPEKCPEHSDAALARQNLNGPRDLREELARQLYEQSCARGIAAGLMQADDRERWSWTTEPEALRQDWRAFAELAMRLCGAVRKPPAEGAG